MAFLPEGFDYIGENIEMTLNQSEKIVGGELINKMCDLAKTSQIWLSLGGFHEVFIFNIFSSE
jgi:hypothetical protein